MTVRATAEYLGGTKVRYTCPRGHTWTEDLGRKSLPKAKRLSEQAVALMARWWSNGVHVDCARCAGARRPRKCGWCDRTVADTVKVTSCTSHPQCTAALRAHRAALFAGEPE